MKKILSLLIALSLTSVSLFAQSAPVTDKQHENFYKHIGRSIRYLPEAVSNDVEGTSIVSFKVKAGSVSDLTVRKSLGNGLDGELVSKILDYKQFAEFKDGNYLLPVAFSLGSPNSQKTEEITLKGFTRLNPVIVVGYKDQAKNKSSIRLRGDLKLEGTKEPLVYLDSILIAYGDIENLDQNSIKSIDVYKGADAISKYGIEALNGVIVVKTKKDQTSSKVSSFKVEGTDQVGVVGYGSKVQDDSNHKGTVVVRGFGNKDQLFDQEPGLKINSDSGKQPLYVLDGKTMSSEDIKGLNPNVIESITILKDASTKALYGIEGYHGVILITTKVDKEKPKN